MSSVETKLSLEWWISFQMDQIGSQIESHIKVRMASILVSELSIPNGRRSKV